MKWSWIFFLSLLIINLILVKIIESSAYAGQKIQKEMKYYWTCVMHPEVHMSVPGICPICHMDLVKKEEKIVSAESKIEERKSIILDQKTFSLSGAKLHSVQKGKFTYSIKTFGKMNGGNHFSLYVSEKDQRYVLPGLAVTLRIPSLDLEEVQGKILRVDSFIDPMGRTVRVDGILTDSQSLKAETSLMASIIYEKENVIKIPEEALMHTGGQDYVFKLNKEKSQLTPVEVKLGLTSLGQIEIQKGLEVGDVITTNANFLIDSESRINFGR